MEMGASGANKNDHQGRFLSQVILVRLRGIYRNQC
jgi:hypothetical protein